MSAEPHRTAYLHGVDEVEQQRLEAQARILGGASFLPPYAPGLRILEVGCGTGVIARELAANDSTCTVVGVDREQAQVATARRLAEQQGLSNVTFMEGDASRLDIADGTFDAAYCRFVLEHVADAAAMIAEMRRVVAPGGWVCAYDWEPDCFVNYPAPPLMAQVWQAIYTVQQELGGNPWVGRTFHGLFTRAGLVDVHVEGRAWSITGNDQEALALYVGGGREIVRQAAPLLIARGLFTSEALAEVDRAYTDVLASADAFVFHGFCWAIGYRKPD